MYFDQILKTFEQFSNLFFSPNYFLFFLLSAKPLQFPAKETPHISTHANLPQSDSDDDDDGDDDDDNDYDDYDDYDDNDDYDDDDDDDDVDDVDDNDDDDDDLTRSKASSKEVVVSRVPANGRDLQFLISNVFVLLICSFQFFSSIFFYLQFLISNVCCLFQLSSFKFSDMGLSTFYVS